MSEDFGLEAHIDFIANGLSEILDALTRADSVINQSITGFAELGDANIQAGKDAEKHESALLSLQTQLTAAREQLGQITVALGEESATVTRGSQEWVKRIQAINAAQNAYAAFARNQVTKSETGTMLDPTTQTGSSQRDLLATNAAKNANYIGVLTQAERELAQADQYLAESQAKVDYSRQVAELGELGAAQLRAAQSAEKLAQAQIHDAGVNPSGSDPSLPTQRDARVAVANAAREQEAAFAALAIVEAKEAAVRERANASLLAQSQQLAAAKAKVSSIQDANAYDQDVASIGRLAAAQKQAAGAAEQLATAERNRRAATTGPTSIQAQTQAENEYAAALQKVRTTTKEVAAAQQQATRSAAVGMPKVGGIGNLSEGELPRLRYALYDVSFAAGIAGAALTGGLVAAGKSAIDFDSDFAQVQRTVGLTGTAATALKNNFIDLSQSIPVSFGDLSQIGALGGQLNIAASDLSDFTRTTAEFSATTDVSSSAAGTALGRLNQLLPDVNGNYEALASSILKVGVNSVATESQIIAISQNIAGIAGTVGLTSDEVVGLSGALASIGTAPEAARSTVTRLFMSIQDAINGDSVALAKFGTLSGETGSQFKAAFKADAGSSLVTLLQGVNAQGDNAVATLQQLGLTSVRDIPTLLKLAQNTDLLKKSLGQASSGFSEGTELQKQYGVIAATLSSKLKVLGNDIQAMFAAIGNSANGPLTHIVDGLGKFIVGVTNLINTPAGQWVAVLALGFTAFIAVALLSLSVLGRVAGSALAMRTAWDALRTATAKSTAATGANIAAERGAAGAHAATSEVIAGETIATERLSLAQRTMNTAAAGAGRATGAIIGGLKGTTSAGTAARGALSGISTLLGGPWGAAIGAAMLGLAALNDQIDKTKAKSSDVQNALATGASPKKTLGLEASANSNVFNSLLSNNGAGELKDLPKLLNQAHAAGESFWNAMGTSSAQYQALNALGGIGTELGKLAVRDLPAARASFAALTTSQHLNKQQQLDLLNSMGDYKDALVGIAQSQHITLSSTGDAANMQKLLEFALKDSATAAKDNTTAALAQGQAAREAADENIAFSDALKRDVGTFLSSSIGVQQLATDLQSLGGSFETNGSLAAIAGSTMSAALQDIAASAASGPAAADQMSTLFSALVAGGFASAAQLKPLIAEMSILTGASISTSKSGAKVNAMMTALKAGAKAAAPSVGSVGSAAAKAAKQVYTLVDYGNDLAGVFSRAFDLRFGNTEALDKISSGWSAIRKNSADAAQAMAEANAKLRQLAADKTVDEYQLRIAKMYGDSARAAEIQASLAQNAVDTKSAQGDLAKAQQDSSKTLTGNSDAAIANRGTIEDLVKSYQDLLSSYAASGMSQADLAKKSKELRQKFVDQATAAGFSKTAIKQYAASFDDMKVAIDGVPRKITVGLDTSGAETALNEFLAKMDAAANGGGGGGGASGGGGGFDLSGFLDGLGLGGDGPKKPIEQTIQFEGDTKSFDDALASLYTKIAKTKMPEVKIGGETKPAAEALTEVVDAINRGQGYVEINGHQVKADIARKQIIDLINKSVGTVMIDGTPVEAGNALSEFLSNTDSSKATVTIDGNKLPATQVLDKTLDAIAHGKEKVTIDGKDYDAKKVLAAVLATIKKSNAAVKINATYDKDRVITLGQLMAQGMKSGIVAYFRGHPITAVIGSSGSVKYNTGTGLSFYDQGGFTGAGGKYDPAGIVHRGEYVFPQEAVRYYGVENLAFAHKRAMRGYSDGGFVGSPSMSLSRGGASTVVSQMTASDRMFFRELFAEFAGSLTVTDGVIAHATSAANARLVKAGVK